MRRAPRASVCPPALLISAVPSSLPPSAHLSSPVLPPSLYTGVTKINGGCYDCSLVLEVLENVMFLKSGIKMLQ